ncbi:MAG: uroporphyrinogen decarboxylase family protein [Candidatus Bathyarchaeia archaeon]
MRGFVEENSERVVKAKRLGVPDGVPVTLSMTGHFICGYVGLKQGLYYRDPKTMYEAQRIVHRDFFGLTSFFPDFGVSMLPSGFGARLLWKEDDAPWVYPLVHSFNEVERLPQPDPYRDGLMPKSIAFYRYMETRAGVELVDYGSDLGPFDTAALLRGQVEILQDMARNPALIDALMEKATRAVIDWFKVKREVVGALPKTRLADDFIGNLSPQLFNRFVAQHYRRVFEEFPSASHELHCDGALTQLLDELPGAGVQVLSTFDPNVNLLEAKRKLGGKVCLQGNVAPFLLLRGSPDEVEEACRRKTAEGSPGGGYILSTGGETIRNTPWRNIYTMIEAARASSPR